MSETKLVRPVNPAKLPPELTCQLRSFKTPDGYTMRELALSFIGEYGHATVDDLMIYIFQMRNRVTSRGYVYQMVHRLRQQGLLQTMEQATPHNVVYKLTEAGEEVAMAYTAPEDI